LPSIIKPAIMMEGAVRKVIGDDIRNVLKKEFRSLRRDIYLHLFIKKGLNDRHNEFTIKFCKELSLLSKKIHCHRHSAASLKAKEIAVETSPVVAVNPDEYDIQFLGAPVGEEGRAFITTITMVSQNRGLLSKESRQRLKELEDQREVMVFVSPTCPYCPQQVVYAVSAAIEAPHRVSVRIVEILENRRLAERFSVVSVPQTVINGNVVAVGVQPEEVFIDALFTGAPVELKRVPAAEKVIKKDLVIVGAGPAGLTAAIYAERSGLKCVVIEKGGIGGQVAVTPVVENYPGFSRIPGKTLMDMMAQQALQYTEIHQGEEVIEIKKTRRNRFRVTTTSNRYLCRGIILATGATHKKLGVPGEERFLGRGVSYCATCDGYFFKDGKKVIIVGGGNSAVTEALYLNSIGVDVTLVHRRDALRAEKRLQDSLKERGIQVLWSTVVEEIIGEEVVKSVRLKDLKKKKTYSMQVDGVFISIGYKPVNALAKDLGLELTEDGYIKVDSRQRTSMPGVYAAGDITGGIKQIVTAVGQGSVAAITAFEDLSNPYWKER